MGVKWDREEVGGGDRVRWNREGMKRMVEEIEDKEVNFPVTA